MSTSRGDHCGPRRLPGGAIALTLSAAESHRRWRVVLTSWDIAPKATSDSLETFADRTFVLCTLAMVVTLIASTALTPLEQLLGTSTLDAQQWGIRALAELPVLALAEGRK